MQAAFNDNDIKQIKQLGLDPETLTQQINIFKRGNVVVNIHAAATVKNGILVLTEEEQAELRSYYNDRKEQLDILKFVPASGAATRMFKSLFSFLNEYDPEEGSLEDYLDSANDSQLEIFFGRMKDLPFFEQITKMIPNYDSLSEDEQQLQFVRTMLYEDGLSLSESPKGLVPFHKYEDHTATAFEEHLVEAADYAASKGKARLHFTVAPDKLESFKEEFSRLQEKLEEETGLQYELSYSSQDPSTDTIAVDLNNEPFRDEEGQLFFRPGGHGSLLKNLQEQEADLIFIKNIDNVVTPRRRELVSDYKKVLAGKLLKLQEQSFSYLQKLEDPDCPEEVLQEVIQFAKEKLGVGTSIDFSELSPEEKRATLKQKLNRPIRVCGMVKNEGEPGGGPFWVRRKTGEISLQIVESAQIDHDNYQQSKIAQEATHFNPVDLVCSIKDYKGSKFNLNEFVNPDTSFISTKTKDGKELKALEHPGLWNGSMSGWISIFVEVPVETFNPVKTVADLLKQSHQVR